MPGRASPLSAQDRPATRCSLTTRGWCLLATGAAVAVCAGLINERDLLRLAAFAATLPLLALAVITPLPLRRHVARPILPSPPPAASQCEARPTPRFARPPPSR